MQCRTRRRKKQHKTRKLLGFKWVALPAGWNTSVQHFNKTLLSPAGQFVVQERGRCAQETHKTPVKANKTAISIEIINKFITSGSGRTRGRRGGGLCLLEEKDRGSSGKKRVLLFLIGPSLTQQPDGRSCNCWRNGREVCGREHMQSEKAAAGSSSESVFDSEAAKFPDTFRTPLFPRSALQYRADERRTGGSKVSKQAKRMKVRRETIHVIRTFAAR